ncbi:Mur ligase [Lasiosphaeria ovina]|uniref:tetrahydrofolate synthase n=1 Tax=Lasiosphaeria ovina TaxID=92902 RepID=A0AAE0NIU8_9PEZI|nr:Mur ligase [Lasiosphaeria ovina]
MASRTYDEALRRLAQLQSNHAAVAAFGAAAKTPGGDPALNARAMPETAAWLRRAGYAPADLAAAGLRCVHVAGTKGKGSVTALVAAVLAQYPAAGPVAAYTSPHVVTPRERIMLQGRPIAPAKFAAYFFELWDRFTAAAASPEAAADGLPTARDARDAAGPATKPFYFRFLTILALHVFVREGVRSAAVETGIGGEYDPTNILPPQAVTAAVVTQLGIDHVAMLGDTLESIAWNKAGIFKSGVPAFTRRLESSPGVMAVLRARAAEKGASALVELDDGDVDRWRGVGDGARLQGPFQKHNMALAAAAARQHLVALGHVFDGEFARPDASGPALLQALPAEFERGLRAATLRGRCEAFVDADSGAEWLVDGAHTEDSLAGVGEWFAGRAAAGRPAARVLVFNQQDREPGPLLAALLAGAAAGNGAAAPVFTHAILTRNNEELAEELAEEDLAVQRRACEALRALPGAAGTETRVVGAVRPAVELARSIARQAAQGTPGKVLVTGSFHLAGAVLRTVGHDVEE